MVSRSGNLHLENIPCSSLGLLIPDVRFASVSVYLSLFAILIPKLSPAGRDSDWPVLGETLESVFVKAPQGILAISTSGYHSLWATGTVADPLDRAHVDSD